MKKTILSFLTTAILITASLAIQSTIVHAQTTTTPKEQFSTIKDIGSELQKRGTTLPDYSTNTNPKASTQQGISNISNAAYYIIEFLIYALGSVAVLLMIVSGIRLVTATDKIDEVKKKEQNHMIYSAVGFILIIIADQAVKRVFFGTSGEILASADNARQFATQGGELFKNIYRFLQAFVGTIAVLVFVFSGVQYALSAGEDDPQSKAKNRIKWGSAGIILVGISELLVFDIVFPNQGSEIPRTQRAIELIVSITNFASAFVASLAILGFIYSGYMYVTGAVQEDNVSKAKQAFLASIIGIVMAAGAFALVNTIAGGLIE